MPNLRSRNTVTLGTPKEMFFRNGDASILNNYAAVVSVFNTPTNSWNTIQFAKMIGGLAGDKFKVSIFKGSPPDDPTISEDDSEVEAQLDPADFIESAEVVLDTDIPATGIFDVQFDFNTTFSQGNLGSTYTVAVEQFDSSNTTVRVSPVFCENRFGVDNFTSLNDSGWNTGDDVTGHGYPPSIGGAGNTYATSTHSSDENFNVIYTGPASRPLVIESSTYWFFTPQEIDSCMPIALFERIHTSAGTIRSVSKTVEIEPTKPAVSPTIM